MFQAGLFSAVASAFIIQVDSQLQPNSGDETAALLRILIYKIDNTTFGNDVPALPKWTGPSSTTVHVEAILFASLAASLLSAFLAMLGKQWLNRYASTDMRGSVIERSQNRQRKLDGIVAWYFDSVMESLPLMLQVALLLLGCALSRYLWEISRTIASVVIGVTSFGLLFYLFILVVGTAWESCPYQTPGSRFFRYLGPIAHGMLHSAASALGKKSQAIDLVWNNLYWSSWDDIMRTSATLALGVPILLAIDFYRLGRAMVMALVVRPIGAYRLLCRMYTWLHDIYSSLFHQGTVVLDLQCILWTLQTSLEKPVHLSALEHLVTITEFTHFDPSLVTDCFNIFVGCLSVSNGKVVIMQGLEQLAMVSARGFFHTLRHLSATRPTSSVLADQLRRYHQVFPFETDFRGLPFYHTMINIHALAGQRHWDSRSIQWIDYKPFTQELIPFAQHMLDIAQAEYQQIQSGRVPRWILRFALHFLSLEPLSPASVIADCLMIIAIALGQNPSSIPISDGRYPCSVLWVPTMLTEFPAYE